MPGKLTGEGRSKKVRFRKGGRGGGNKWLSCSIQDWMLSVCLMVQKELAYKMWTLNRCCS